MPLEPGNLYDNPTTPVKFGLNYDILATSRSSITLVSEPCGGIVTNIVARARAAFPHTTIFGGEPGQVISHNGQTATQMIFDAGDRLCCPDGVTSPITLTDVSDVSLSTGQNDGKVLTVFPFAATYEPNQPECSMPTSYFYRVYVEDRSKNGNSGYYIQGFFRIRIPVDGVTGEPTSPSSSSQMKSCSGPYTTTE